MSEQRTRVLATSAVFMVKDVVASLEWYCDKLGFTDPGTWGEPAGFGMANRDGFDLMLSVAESPDEVHPNGGDTADLYIRVEDVEAEKRALEAAGVTVERGPFRTVYNMIEIEIRDPNGYRIVLAQDVAGNN
jgi:catechol 2,3-dioxygenase-like lactoylglutathione lyase family enzyme